MFNVLVSLAAQCCLVILTTSILSASSFRLLDDPKLKITSQIVKQAASDATHFSLLEEFCDTFGHRLSGSVALERSLDWIVEKMKKDGFTSVTEEKVMVPVWVRGPASCSLVSPRVHAMPILALGGSVSTPTDGIEADVIVVSSFEDLEAKAVQVKGKIVLYNVPFTSYGPTVKYRTEGAFRASKLGAVASLIRAVASYSMQTPHTGAMSNGDGTMPKIPHASITVEDAMMLARMQARGQRVRVKMNIQTTEKPPAPSRNIIAEIRGTEKPNEIIVFGGHIDSWDVGQGAMDDAGGCFVSWHVLKIFNQLGIKPKRTIRCVFWTNEENGLQGGETYAANSIAKGETHVAAIETDGGVFTPEGFGFTGSEPALKEVQSWLPYFKDFSKFEFRKGGGGADISPLTKTGVPSFGLDVEGTKYFWFHHTEADTIDKLNPKEVNQCAAVMAILVYLLSEQTTPLSR